MKVHQAMDSGVAALSDGSEVKITKGEVVVQGDRKYEVVLNDIKAQAGNPDRVPLFQEMDLGDEEPAAPASKARLAPRRQAT